MLLLNAVAGGGGTGGWTVGPYTASPGNNTAGGNTTTATGINTLSPVSCDLLIGVAASNGAYPGTAFNDNKGSTFTFGVSDTLNPTSVGMRIDYLVPAVAGTNTGAGHTLTRGSVEFCPVAFLGFAGCHKAGPLAQVSHGAASSAGTLQAGAGITTTTNGCMIIAAIGVNAVSVSSIDSGFTILTPQQGYVSGQSYGCCVAYFYQATAGLINPTWTMSGSNVCAAGLIAFLPGP